MQPFKRLAEWYLGIPTAEPGQGTAWNLETNSPWPAWLPPWLVLILGVALVAAIVWAYRRDAGWAPLRIRMLLTGLRLTAVALVLWFLSHATLTVERVGLPVVVVLIDDSASMGLEDHFRDADIENAVRELVADAADQGRTRLSLAKRLLTRDEGDFLKQIARRHKLRVYRFSETAIALGRTEYLRADDVNEMIPLLAGLKADGSRTRPGPAVRKVLNDLRGAPPAAIVILTDGISSTGDADKLSTVADLAASHYVPIYTVGLGSEDPARDLQLYDVLADEVAFVDDVIPFAAKLKSYGYKGQDVVVTLREAGSTTVLASKTIRADDDGKPINIEVPYTPKVEGEFDYTLEVVPLADETNVENNAETQHVSVRGERIRVLLVDSQPRYEFRAIKQLLEREKTVELHVVLQEADLEFSAEDRTALNHFPVKKEELFQYDVVIFGDVHPGRLSSGALENLRDFVLDAGGGLIVIAGPLHMPLQYAGTPLEVMLPIEFADAKSPPQDEPIVESFRPALTIDGRKGTSLFHFAESDADNDKIWNSLPELNWLLEAPKIKSGARVFVERSGQGGAGGKLPVIAMQHYGAGKVLFHATDELWRWRFLVGDLYYGRYWAHAIRFLSRSKLLGRDRSAELTVDRGVYECGDTVRLQVRFLDERLIPTQRDGVAVMVERGGDVQRKIELKRLPQAPTVFEGVLTQAAEGAYHAWVATPSFKEKPPATDFRVEAPQRELQVRSLDRADLQQTAEKTHGRYYSIASAPLLPDELPRGEPVPLETREPIALWNRSEVLVLFALVLLAEWLLRKRLRLV